MAEKTSHYLETVEKCKKLLETNHNIILHGAPGTGKTHLAKEIAKLMGDTNPGFVQFHPSYDYTDFIEGLRPIKGKKDKDLKFELRDGTFKKFCANAQYHTHDINHVWDNLSELIMNKGVKRFDNKTIDGIENQDERPYIFIEKQGNRNDPYRLRIQKDILIDFLGLGITKEDLTQDKLNELYINKLKEKYAEKEQQGLGNSAEYYAAILKFCLETKVFIIDEINRGELSKIFGELFFSIDPGYRGVEGAVLTQYANMQDTPNTFDKFLENNDGTYGHFFVPENVYIIGTMNDIDHSIEDIDFATRRRFKWIEIDVNDTLDEILPNVDKKIKDKINALNNKIEEKLGKDYKLGAAYFQGIDEKNLEEIWENSIKGSLQAYLRGDMGAEELIETWHDTFIKG